MALIYDVLGVRLHLQSYDKYNPAEWPFCAYFESSPFNWVGLFPASSTVQGHAGLRWCLFFFLMGFSGVIRAFCPSPRP